MASFNCVICQKLTSNEIFWTTDITEKCQIAVEDIEVRICHNNALSKQIDKCLLLHILSSYNSYNMIQYYVSFFQRTDVFSTIFCSKVALAVIWRNESFNALGILQKN